MNNKKTLSFERIKFKKNSIVRLSLMASASYLFLDPSLILAQEISAPKPVIEVKKPEVTDAATKAKTTPSAATTPTAVATPATAASETVTVTGERPTNKIDRQTYDVTTDPVAQAGTAADALNRVPSVNVDAQGNLTLRGQSNVKVLINGRENAEMRGENRAAALLSTPGADIQSIEVMNNPGAAFSSEGSGGIINIVLRQGRSLGKRLTLNVNIGPNDRQNANLSGSLPKGKFTFTGGLNYRKDGRTFISSSDTIRKNVTTDGTTANTLNTSFSNGRTERIGANFGVEYAISEFDTIGTQMNISKSDNIPEVFNQYSNFDRNKVLIRDYIQTEDGDSINENFGFGVNYEHRFKNYGELLKAGLNYSNSNSESDSRRYFDYTTPIDETIIENRIRVSENNTYTANLDYEKPVGNSKITTGYQITIDDNAFNNLTTSLNQRTGVLTSLASQSNDFEYYQKVNAVYFTYQMALGEKWTTQFGSRVENTDLNTFNLKTNVLGSSHYTNLNPSGFLTYNISKEKKIRSSYSRRLQRPNPQDLDPSIVYQSADRISVGNPNLQPQTTDSFEVGYEYFTRDFNWQLRSFYRLNDNIITSFQRFVTDTIIETSRINGRTSQNMGIEYNIDKRFGTKYRVRLNSNLGYTTQESIDANVGKLDAFSGSIRLNAEYRPTEKDRFDFMFGQQGKQLTAQGYRLNGTQSMISYNHNFTRLASLTITVTDPFAMAKTKNVTDSSTIFAISKQKVEPRTFYIGFRITWRPANANANNQERNRPQGSGRPQGGGGFGGQGGFGGGGFGGGGGF